MIRVYKATVLATGLLALLDDVAAIAKAAAASLDDVAGQTGKAAAKAAGVVIDDAAMTPRYVVGLAADRELPIVGKIALGSLRNKLLFLLPGALVLSLVAPWAINPLLMIGGLYLAYEGAEKIVEIFHAGHDEGPSPATDSKALEDEKVAGAVKTDFILSAEIMAITLAAVAEGSFWTKAFVLAAVGVLITLGVYGAVAVIVKADDVGVSLARSHRPTVVRGFGAALVRAMPIVLKILSAVGVVAMIWVAGGIFAHGLENLGFPQVQHAIHDAGSWGFARINFAPESARWLFEAGAAGVFGLILGLMGIPFVKLATLLIRKISRKRV